MQTESLLIATSFLPEVPRQELYQEGVSSVIGVLRGRLTYVITIWRNTNYHPRSYTIIDVVRKVVGKEDETVFCGTYYPVNLVWDSIGDVLGQLWRCTLSDVMMMPHNLNRPIELVEREISLSTSESDLKRIRRLFPYIDELYDELRRTPVEEHRAYYLQPIERDIRISVGNVISEPSVN